MKHKGTGFSRWDMVCYAVGCGAFAGIDTAVARLSSVRMPADNRS